VLALAALGSPCAVAQPAGQAPAGTTPATAIVLPRIADEFHGVVAEQTYIAAHFPTWHIESQSTIEAGGRRYDLIGMVKPDKSRTTIYFDITGWAGK